MDASSVQQCYTNLQLSFRGSERQPPHVLSLAFFMSKVMQECADNGTHDKALSTAQRLRLAVEAFNSKDGVLAKWAIDEEKEKATLNLLSGTTEKARQIISGHLAYHKWRECCFSAELLKSTRWLLGSCPKASSQKDLLTVTPKIQEAFLRNMVNHFVTSTRKVRASARSKHRPSLAEWDKLVSYSCVMEAVKSEMKKHYSNNPDKIKELRDVLKRAYMSRPGQTVLVLSPFLRAGTTWQRSWRA